MSMMCRPMWPFLLMYGSYDMRRTVFGRLTMVNGTLGNRGVTIILFLYYRFILVSFDNIIFS